MVELVIFDMDGLMLDTERVSSRASRDVFPPITEEELQRDFHALLGRNRRQCVAYMQQAHPGWDVPALWKKAEDRMTEIIKEEGVPLKKGLIPLLEYLQQAGIHRAVATSTSEGRARWMLEQGGLTPYFQAFAFGDMVQNSKPDPEIFLLAARQLHVPSARCMVLEDSLVGIWAAAAAGMAPVMVPDAQQPDAATRALLYALCEDLSQVIGLVERANTQQR